MNQLKVKVKKGDKVVMRKGKDRGKSGKILKVILGDGKVVVEGLNLHKKNVRPKKEGQKGQIVDTPGVVRIDNVQLFCSSCNKGARVGYTIKGDKKERYCKRCQAKV